MNIGEYRTLLNKIVWLRGGDSRLPETDDRSLMRELEDMWKTLSQDEQRELRSASQTPTSVRRYDANAL